MANEKRLDIKVAASAAGFEETTKRVRALSEEARRLAAANRPGGPGTFGGGLKSLQQGAAAFGLAGEGSLFTLAQGGGVLAGVTLGIHALTSALEAWATRVEEGRETWQDFIKDFARGIPILNKGVELGEAMQRIGAATLLKRQGLLSPEDNERIGTPFQGQLAARKEIEEEVKRLERESDASRRTAAAERQDQRSRFLNQPAAAAKLEQVAQDTDRKLHDLAVLYEKAGKLLVASDRQRLQQRILDMQVEQDKTDDVRRANAQREAVQEVVDKAIDRQLAMWKSEADSNARIFELEQQRREHGVEKELHRKAFNADLFGREADLLEGIPGRKPDAEEFKVRQRIAAEELALAKQLKDPLLTRPQKDLIKQMIEGLPALQRELISNVAREAQPPNRTTLDNSRFLTGVGNPVEATFKRTEKNTAEQAKWAKMLFEFLKTRSGVASSDLIASPF